MHGGCHTCFEAVKVKNFANFAGLKWFFSHDDYLPSYEELTVPEITMSSAPLKAGAIYFGKYCDDICKVDLSFFNEVSCVISKLITS